MLMVYYKVDFVELLLSLPKAQVTIAISQKIVCLCLFKVHVLVDVWCADLKPNTTGNWFGI